MGILRTFSLGEGDTLPVLVANLLDENDEPANITGQTLVQLRVYIASTGALFTATMSVDTENPAVVRYAWQAADWAADKLVVGEHDMQIKVVGSAGQVKFPNHGYDKLLITAELVAAS